MQNRVLRILTSCTDPIKPTKELLQETGILSVHQHSYMATLRLLHRSILAGKPKLIMSQIEVKPATRTSQETIKPINSRLNLRDESLLVKAIQLYNKVPAAVKTLKALKES